MNLDKLKNKRREKNVNQTHYEHEKHESWY